MDTSFQSNFSYCAELWRFIRSRFAFQAKQVKKLTDKPLAQSYELVAIAHGFSSWRGLSKAIDAMAEIDTLLSEDQLRAAFSGNQADERPARLALAVGFRIDDIMDDDDLVDWAIFERSIARLPALADHDDFDVIEALSDVEPLRSHLFYKAIWMGQEAPWSDNLLQVFYDCQIRLRHHFKTDDPGLFLITKAMFGRGHLDQGFDWDLGAYTVKDYNTSVARILKSNKASPSDGPFKEIDAVYQLALESNMIRVDELRKMMHYVHPGALDSWTKGSFALALLFCNAPNDSIISVRLIQDQFANPQEDCVHQFEAGDEAFAPTQIKAAQLSAALPSAPTVSRLSEKEAIQYRLPPEWSDWYRVAAT